MNAREVMRRRVAVVSPETPLADVARFLDRRHISGVPVVGHEGNLLGVVTRTDLLRHIVAHEPGTTAAEAMTPWVVSVEEETPVEELARQMVRKRIHRVLITREGRLTGIVTSLDLLRAYAHCAGGRHAAIST